MKYSVVTFGCRVNQADSLGFEEELRAAGASSASAEDADLVVVNTCSVTSSADQGARQTIRRIARSNPSARFVVTGCYATRAAEEVRDLPNVVRVVPNGEKPQLVQVLRASGELTTANRFGDGDGSCGSALEPGVAGRTAFTLRVQTGCAETCAYCIIPTTRGAPRSVPVDAVLRESARVVEAGFKEVALTGVHLGSYGRDLAPRSSLVALLRALADSDIAGACRFRVSSLEPMDCTADVVALVSERACFAHHFHLPLQHATNGMLRAMRRPYTVEYYAALVDRIRSLMPNAAIGSDVIVGFPGETDEDFEALRSYLVSSPLTHLHVFPYSDRPGTDASALRDRAPGAVIRERARVIRDISRTLNGAFRASQSGTTHRALTIEDGSLVVTGNYLKVRIPPGRARNEWVDVLLEDGGELPSGRLLLSLDDQLSAGGADVASAALAH
ncbi:MAG TPA: MiaB/RimO family radical SAM methylthiotransferase [Vicinamibacterales bacterium]|nr:MiaB/RimO family radical SAM methylthiotransferase [Vicinamibacterales bacterium]